MASAKSATQANLESFVGKLRKIRCKRFHQKAILRNIVNLPTMFCPGLKSYVSM